MVLIFNGDIWKIFVASEKSGAATEMEGVGAGLPILIYRHWHAVLTKQTVEVSKAW